MSVARGNGYTIVEYSTAYPFRLPDYAIMCVYCCESYREPEQFRQHMEANHQDCKTKHAFHHVHEGYLKVDITDLRCRICKEAYRSLEDIARHLNDVHFRTIDFEHELGLLPFRMEKDKLSCPICDYKSANLRGLSRHIQTHYFQCICEHCGKEYATNTSLVYHVKYGCLKSGNTLQGHCRKCKKPVASFEEHFRDSMNCRQHICGLCGERFGYWKEKQKHMEEVHRVPRRTYPCPECDLVYKCPGKLKTHFKTSHTDDYMACVHCGQRFDTKYRLSRHMIIHTGEKSFICNVCSKRFNRQSTLTQHMWIHSEVKKHECKICDKTFNQRVCWKSHMKARHPEIYDPQNNCLNKSKVSSSELSSSNAYLPPVNA